MQSSLVTMLLRRRRCVASTSLISWPVPRFESSDPPWGETFQNLMQVRPVRRTRPAKALPQLKSRERAAHAGNVSEHPFGQIGQEFSQHSNGFRSLTDSIVRVSRPQPASRLHCVTEEGCPENCDVPRGFAEHCSRSCDLCRAGKRRVLRDGERG